MATGTGLTRAGARSHGPIEETSSCQEFTDFVRWLDAAPELSDSEPLKRVWAALRKALQSEIERRGLWQCPPSYLGVYGWTSWGEIERDPREALGERNDALEELAADCYAYIFLDRFQSLKAQLRIKPALEGLIFRNIRNFLYERQRRHDPLGFRVFEVLRNAVQRAVQDGDLMVASGDPRIRNETVLAVSSPPRHSDDSRLAIAELVAGWANDLVPDLMTARGAAREAMETGLGEHLRDLATRVESFPFKHLLDPLKDAVRTRWASLLQASLGLASPLGAGEDDLSSATPPEIGFEDEDNYRQLVECVDRRLAELEIEGRTREYLLRLWHFLKASAAEAGVASAAKPPSQRRTARLLELPRERLPGLYGILGELIQTCRSDTGVSGPHPVEGHEVAE